MNITKIEEFDKKRVKIYIEFEFAFVLYKGELRNLSLKEGEELAEEVYQEIKGKVLPKRAKLRCLNLLKTRSYTERQLIDKLKQGFYTPDIVEEAIAYVKSYGYVDDFAYARDYIQYKRNTKSRKRLEQDLCQKGIDKKIIQEIFSEIEENEGAIDELQMAKEILKKKNFNRETTSMRDIQKLSAFLYRKGFQAETIRSALLLDIT